MEHEELIRIWKESVTFEVEIIEVESACRAAHKKGEKFVFSWNTPEGMCGEDFVGMYPVLFSLRIGGDMTLLGSEEKNTRVYTCPSRVVKFKITAVEHCPLCGKTDNLSECDVPVGDTTYTLKLCPECRATYTK